MKKPILALLALGACFNAGFADDVAVLDIRIGPEKTLHRVAIEFYEDAAPATVANFKKLARKRFYNGTAFHRVFPHLMVQAGDPLSSSSDRRPVGTGGPGYNIPAEINSHKHGKGTVSTGRLPDKINPARVSNGSQFFITLAPMPDYNGQYTVFGHVIDGIEVLDAISQLPADTNDNPVQRVEIQSMQIVPREKAATVKPKRSLVRDLLRHVW